MMTTRALRATSGGTRAGSLRLESKLRRAMVRRSCWHRREELPWSRLLACGPSTMKSRVRMKLRAAFTTLGGAEDFRMMRSYELNFHLLHLLLARRGHQ